MPEERNPNEPEDKSSKKKSERQRSNRGSSVFQELVRDFAKYIEKVSNGALERIDDPEDQLFAQILVDTATHIASTLRDDLLQMYERAESDVRTHIDDAANRSGGGVLLKRTIEVIDSPEAQGNGVWDKLIEIAEAIKKILNDIISIEIFGVSLKDIIDVVIDIDAVLRALDNILQTIAEVFSGKRLRQAMYDAEMRNINMTIKLAELRRARKAA